jgi:hypothetical protein
MKLYGVWCVEDRAWCPALAEPFRGCRTAAEVEAERWRSGERADVEPGAFRYEVRPIRVGRITTTIHALSTVKDGDWRKENA